MAKTFIGVRLTSELAELVRRAAAERGETMTAVVRRALTNELQRAVGR